MININFLVEFELWETVYVRTDPDRLARVVTGYIYRGNNVMYVCTLDSEEDYFFEQELTRDINNCLNQIEDYDQP